VGGAEFLGGVAVTNLIHLGWWNRVVISSFSPNAKQATQPPPSWNVAAGNKVDKVEMSARSGTEQLDLRQLAHLTWKRSVACRGQSLTVV
jgi:hypothetical protein